MVDPCSDFLSEIGNNMVDNFIKQEPLQEMGSSSASVPIPGGHRSSRGIFDQFSPSPLMNSAIWENRPDIESPYKTEPMYQLDTSFKMDDDIFQVDKADLIQGPTLAELNANDDTLLGDLNFGDLLLPEENIQPMRVDLMQPNVLMSNNRSADFASSSFPQSAQIYHSCTKYTRIPAFNAKSNIYMDSSDILSLSGSYNLEIRDLPENASTSQPSKNVLCRSTLHELLSRKEKDDSITFPQKQMELNNACLSKLKPLRLSISAPTRVTGLEQIWARREPRQHLLSTGSLGVAEAESTSSVSTRDALSPDTLAHIEPLSHDEGFEDSDDDSDHYDDCSSDNDSASEGDESINIKFGCDTVQSKDCRNLKKEKFFWQYNVQAKGPKGQRLVTRARLDDPHILNEVTDPVFSPYCALRGIKHSGKARKGDGNDLTPNPKKLHSIGRELDKLARVINDMTPVSELPFPVRPKTRKEKNKLASRACRLKKKAQHEANKIKLHGLEQEHKKLIHGLIQAKQVLVAKISERNPKTQDELTKQMDKICKTATRIRIANHSTEFVNKILGNIKSGVHDGGIEDF